MGDIYLVFALGWDGHVDCCWKSPPNHHSRLPSLRRASPHPQVPTPRITISIMQYSTLSSATSRCCCKRDASTMAKDAVRVLVTGAAGNSHRSLLPLEYRIQPVGPNVVLFVSCMLWFRICLTWCDREVSIHWIICIRKTNFYDGFVRGFKGSPAV